MDSSFATAHKYMLRYEGGYSNHPADPGGVTLNGITQRVYNAWRKSRGQPTKTLTRAMIGDAGWIAERDAIYRSDFWVPPGCPALKAGPDGATYDYSVNSGPGRAIRVLQKLCGRPVTGRLTQEDIAAANKRDPGALVKAICDERIAFLHSLSTWPTFGAGWGRRVSDVRVYCAGLVTGRSITMQPDAQQPGKGVVPDKKAAKNTTAAAGAGGSAAAGANFADWVSAHPMISVAVVAAVVVGVAYVFYLLDKSREKQQNTPMPGIDVVPEAATS